MKAIKIMMLAVVAVAVASCCNCRKGKSKVNMPLINTTWQLTQIEGAAFEAKGDSYTIVFNEDGKLNGKGDCNRLFGPYEISGQGTISFKTLASTRAMCMNQAMENKFMSLIQATDGYTIDGKLLMLTSDGELKLILSAVEKSE